jgi:RNA polymerase sigma factor (sigma-70 family)
LLQSLDPAERDAAAQAIWQRYSDQLLRVAAATLFDGVRAREDEQDVVQDAFASFCQRQQRGDYQLDGRNGLLSLLVTITARKACNINHHHQAQGRDYRQEQRVHAAEPSDSVSSWLLEQIDSAQASPQMAAIFREEFTRHLAMLSDEVRRAVVLCWVEGQTRKQAAQEMKSSVRTIARCLEIARETWRRRHEMADEAKW